jgi:hypothetical protein
MISVKKLKKITPNIEFSAKFSSLKEFCFKKILQKKLPKVSKVIALTKLDMNISTILFELDFNYKIFIIKQN